MFLHHPTSLFMASMASRNLLLKCWSFFIDECGCFVDLEVICILFGSLVFVHISLMSASSLRTSASSLLISVKEIATCSLRRPRLRGNGPFVRCLSQALGMRCHTDRLYHRRAQAWPEPCQVRVLPVWSTAISVGQFWELPWNFWRATGNDLHFPECVAPLVSSRCSLSQFERVEH